MLGQLKLRGAMNPRVRSMYQSAHCGRCQALKRQGRIEKMTEADLLSQARSLNLTRAHDLAEKLSALRQTTHTLDQHAHKAMGYPIKKDTKHE